MPTSTKRRTRLGPADGIRVKQSPTLDYTKLPIDDCSIPLLITGGEALEICHASSERRGAAIKRRKFNRQKVLKVLTPKRGSKTLPPKTQIVLDEIRPNFVKVRIAFDVPNGQGEGEKAAANIQKLYAKWVEGETPLKLNKGAWDSGGRGVQYCKVAFDIQNDFGKLFKKLVHVAIEALPDSSSIADELLLTPDTKSQLDWWVRSGDRSPSGGFLMKTPGVHQVGRHWFLMLPAHPSKIPQDIYLPRGDFKRLTMSQYWKLQEAAAVGE